MKQQRCPFLHSVTSNTPILKSNTLITDLRLAVLNSKLRHRKATISLIKKAFSLLRTYRSDSYKGLGLYGFNHETGTFDLPCHEGPCSFFSVLYNENLVITLSASVAESIIVCMEKVLSQDPKLDAEINHLLQELRQVDSKPFLAAGGLYFYEEVIPGIMLLFYIFEHAISLQDKPDVDFTCSTVKNTLGVINQLADTSEIEFSTLSNLLTSVMSRQSSRMLSIKFGENEEPWLAFTPLLREAFRSDFANIDIANYKIRCPALFVNKGAFFEYLVSWTSDIVTYFWPRLVSSSLR